MGRPKLKIDEDEVGRLAYEGASNREIADFVGVDESTIRDRFPALLRKRRAERRFQLRQAQTRAALDGNPTMLIWLGKVELDQKESSLAGKVTKLTIEYVDPDAPTPETPSEPEADQG